MGIGFGVRLWRGVLVGVCIRAFTMSGGAVAHEACHALQDVSGHLIIQAFAQRITDATCLFAEFLQDDLILVGLSALVLAVLSRRGSAQRGFPF